jgi:hypothetical protein
MQCAAKMIVAAILVATLSWSANAMGGLGGGATSAASVYAVPTGEPPPPPVAKAYCATPVGACLLGRPRPLGDSCSCRVTGRRAFGTIVAQ